MVKGYQFARHQYVTFTNEEFKALEAVKSETIDIVELVPLETVGRINLEKVYFLSPGKGGDRPYKLLAIALQKTGKAGIVRYGARGKGYLVMIRPMGDGLAMEQLHYADDLRSFDEVELSDLELKDAEVDLAIQIIDQVSVEDYDPTKYNDEVKGKILELIQQKVDGKEVIEMPQAPAEEKFVDLIDALRASRASKGAKAEEKRWRQPMVALARRKQRNSLGKTPIRFVKGLCEKNAKAEP